MSYNIYFEIDTGGAEPACVDNELNHTSNCAPMFNTAMEGGIRGLQGILENAVRHPKATISVSS